MYPNEYSVRNDTQSSLDGIEAFSASDSQMDTIRKTHRLEHILDDDAVFIRYAEDDVVHMLC